MIQHLIVLITSRNFVCITIRALRIKGVGNGQIDDQWTWFCLQGALWVSQLICCYKALQLKTLYMPVKASSLLLNGRFLLQATFHRSHVEVTVSLINKQAKQCPLALKPRLHERFFACNGDAIFLKLSRCQHAVKIACVATLWRSPWFCRKTFNSLNFSRFFSAIFSSVASPVRGWLHMRFSPRAGDATIFKKIASPSQAKTHSCSCGLNQAKTSASMPGPGHCPMCLYVGNTATCTCHLWNVTCKIYLSSAQSFNETPVSAPCFS